MTLSKLITDRDGDVEMKKGKQFIIISSILAVVSTVIKIYHDTNFFKVQPVHIQTKKIPKGSSFSILQLSDIHNKVFINNNEMFINKVSKINADVIVLTGDLIDRKTKELVHVFHLVEKLIAINPRVYFVSGNHEWDNPKREELFNGLRNRGVILLDNKSRTITLANTRLTLIGVADFTTQHADLDLAMQSREQADYTVLLSHAPDISWMLADTPIDVTLSGHTHGGQIRFPFIGGIVAPGQGYFPKLDKGLYPMKNGKYVYVDSGVGTTWFPIRFLNQSQMSLIKITGE
ncbi:metallophosphoesterase [Paraliobacillus zengyii]|uniref:metallophosphoesterase n=2 Tax=Paraliobacillus zengyii TaxID=2213194 RepID=UPI001F541560|nr:metallophosphoesterase [Paraliobacillus zengyii]